MKPVADEHRAPITNASVLSGPSPTNTPTVKTIENKNNIEYSFFMKVIAPR